MFRHVRYELVSNFVSRFLELLKLSSSFMSGVRAPYQLVSLCSGSQASQMHRGRKWECLFTPSTCAYCGFGPSLGGNTVAVFDIKCLLQKCLAGMAVKVGSAVGTQPPKPA